MNQGYYWRDGRDETPFDGTKDHAMNVTVLRIDFAGRCRMFPGVTSRFRPRHDVRSR